jgi:hypothetical protein
MQISHYKQLPNACGLSTFLMLINPEKNLEFKLFLDKMYKYIEFQITELPSKFKELKEYKWSIVLTYVLLKCIDKNELYFYLEKTIPEIIENYATITMYTLQELDAKETQKYSKVVLNFYLDFFTNFKINQGHFEGIVNFFSK